MESDTIKKIVASLCDPIDHSQRIYLTQRSILFLIYLFSGKRIDIIDLHCILLRIAFTSGCLKGSRKYMTLKDIVVYLHHYVPVCISIEDIKDTSDRFNLDNDNEYHEVEDMKIIVSSIHC